VTLAGLFEAAEIAASRLMRVVDISGHGPEEWLAC
jgi:hypothetical protein